MWHCCLLQPSQFLNKCGFGLSLYEGGAGINPSRLVFGLSHVHQRKISYFHMLFRRNRSHVCLGSAEQLGISEVSTKGSWSWKSFIVFRVRVPSRSQWQDISTPRAGMNQWSVPSIQLFDCNSRCLVSTCQQESLFFLEVVNLQKPRGGDCPHSVYGR